MSRQIVIGNSSVLKSFQWLIVFVKVIAVSHMIIVQEIVVLVSEGHFECRGETLTVYGCLPSRQL